MNISRKRKDNETEITCKPYEKINQLTCNSNNKYIHTYMPNLK